jgi:hypothetical protein
MPPEGGAEMQPRDSSLDTTTVFEYRADPFMRPVCGPMPAQLPALLDIHPVAFGLLGYPRWCPDHLASYLAPAVRNTMGRYLRTRMTRFCVEKTSGIMECPAEEQVSLRESYVRCVPHNDGVIAASVTRRVLRDGLVELCEMIVIVCLCRAA